MAEIAPWPKPPRSTIPDHKITLFGTENDYRPTNYRRLRLLAVVFRPSIKTPASIRIYISYIRPAMVAVIGAGVSYDLVSRVGYYKLSDYPDSFLS